MPPKLCLVCSDPATFEAFLAPHAQRLLQSFHVSLNCSAPPRAGTMRGIHFIQCRIPREITPAQDALALLRLISTLWRGGFDVVHSVTPKAGLLAMLAAAVVGVPSRIHTFTGQVWVTAAGFKRLLLRLCDRIIYACASATLADSHSQSSFLRAQGIAYRSMPEVLGKGSISGVCLDRFKPDPETRRKIRSELGIQESEFVFLYLGRLKKDKGVHELLLAYAAVAARHPHARLLIVGRDEEELTAQIEPQLTRFAGKIRILPATPTPETYLQSADVLCLLSFREGFGSVVIEAAAAGIPALATAIYGLTDAVENGITGRLVEPRSVPQATRAMEGFLEDCLRTGEMGRSARVRAEVHFDQRVLTQLLLNYHAGKLAAIRPDLTI